MKVKIQIILLKKERKKENGAHKHLSSSQISEHQNIHVMLSYAKIATDHLKFHQQSLLKAGSNNWGNKLDD